MYESVSDRRGLGNLNRVACFLRVVPEHVNGFKREGIKVFAYEIKFFQYIIRSRDDVTAYSVRLKQIEQFARACPDQFRLRIRLQKLDHTTHDRHGVAASVCYASCEDRDKVSGKIRKVINHFLHLLGSHQRCDVYLHTRSRETFDERTAGLAFGIRHGNLDEYAFAPRSDFERLKFHLLEVIREDLEGYRTIRDYFENF